MSESTTKTSALRIFGQPKMAVLLFLGFSSGLPFYLTSKTLQAWMTTAKVDLATIGFFSLVTLPYSLKFVWAPLMDRYVPPFLGRRRGWVFITQVLLLLAIAAMSLHDPRTGLKMLAINAIAIAFFSASQDISLDAYRTDVVRDGIPHRNDHDRCPRLFSGRSTAVADGVSHPFDTDDRRHRHNVRGTRAG